MFHIKDIAQANILFLQENMPWDLIIFNSGLPQHVFMDK